MTIQLKRIFSFLLASVVLFNFPSASYAFNPEEHKAMGDLGSEAAIKAIKKVVGQSNLIKFKHNPGEVRIVVRNRIPNNKRFKGSYVPRERALEVKNPLLIWVGAADRSSGEWFTFGDLVSLYGDFRRIITCDAKAANSDCRLTDRPKPLPGNYNPAKFTKQRYKAMKDLAQGWNFWDAHLISSQASSVLVTNRGVIEGKNHKGAWSDEFYKIAKGNHWHFGPTALKWYVAMHRQAFYLMSKAAQAKNVKDRQILIWKAMHYEGHALHSLTDLFAPGHVMVDRYATTDSMLASNKQQNAPFPSWQANIWKTTFSSAAPKGKLLKKPRFQAVSKVNDNDLNVITGPTSLTVRNARYESQFHNKFNVAGSEVRNLKSSLKPSQFASSRRHSKLPKIWRALGDGDLYEYKGKRRLNPGQGEWAQAAVEDSILSLFDGYRLVVKGGDPRRLSMAPALFDALGDIPIEMRNVCVDNKKQPKRCFAPDGKTGKPAKFRPVSYTGLVLKLLGIKKSHLVTSQALPICTGDSAINGPSSDLLREGCEQSWDKGRPSMSERLQAEAGR